MNHTRLGRAAVIVSLIGIYGAPGAVRAEPEGKLPAQWWGEDRPARIGPFARDVRLSADGGRLVVGWGTGVRTWDLTAGRAQTLHDDTEKWVYGPRLSPDGRYVVGNRGAEPDWQLVIWDAATGKEVRAEPKLTRRPADYWRQAVLGFDRDGGAWVTRAAGVVDRVEVPSGRITRTVRLPFTAGAWGRLVLSPDGRWLALGGGTVFAVRRTDPDADWAVVGRHAEAEKSEDLPQPTACPVPCGFSADGKRLVTYDRKGEVIALWEVGEKPARLAARAGGLTPWTHLDDLAFTPDGRRFAFVLTSRPAKRTATELRVWDAATLAEVSRISPPVGVDGFAFMPTGKRVLLTHPDGTLTVREWDGGR